MKKKKGSSRLVINRETITRLDEVRGGEPEHQLTSMWDGHGMCAVCSSNCNYNTSAACPPDNQGTN